MKQKLKNEISQIFEKLTYTIENNANTEEKLITAELKKHSDLKKLSLSLTEYHIISYVGDNKGANGTSIAKSLGITKGGVSKATAKLLKKELITTEKLPNNKKEIYYNLSLIGEQVYAIHEEMHKKAQIHFQSLIEKYSDIQLSSIKSFLKDIYTDLKHK